MIVECPQCGTRYNLPEDKISPDGSQVRCSKCEHVFDVYPPSPPESDDFADLERELAGDLDDDFGEDTAGPAANRRTSENVSLDTDGVPTLDDEEPDLDDDRADGSLGFDLDDEPKKGGGSKKKLLLIALVVLLLVGGGAGLWFSGLLDGLGGQTGGGTQAEQAEESSTQPLSNEEAVRNIELSDVRQYYVDNEKAGRILVIEGKAVNRFDTAKDLIKVEGTLFDAQGSALDSRQLLAGNTMSFFQLQILSRTEIEAALNSELGILSNNTNLAPGSSTPLMLVFFEPPENVAEFGLRVIEAKDPPEE